MTFDSWAILGTGGILLAIIAGKMVHESWRARKLKQRTLEAVEKDVQNEGSGMDASGSTVDFPGVDGR